MQIGCSLAVFVVFKLFYCINNVKIQYFIWYYKKNYATFGSTLILI